MSRPSQEQRLLRDYPETSPSESAGLALMGSRLKLNLYLMCGLTDFASFVCGLRGIARLGGRPSRALVPRPCWGRTLVQCRRGQHPGRLAAQPF